MALTTRNFKLTVIEIVFSDGTSTVETLNPVELAGMKRSKKWKGRVTVKKIAVIDMAIKTLK